MEQNKLIAAIKLLYPKSEITLFGKHAADIACFTEMIAEQWNKFSVQQWAYFIATCWHETSHTCAPVVEAFYAGYEYQKKLKYFPFIGRGYVQITWERNYALFGKLLGLPLVTTPALAKDPETAFQIAVIGFERGLFTGKKMDDYINSMKCDYANARRIINGTDDAKLIAGYASIIEKALK